MIVIEKMLAATANATTSGLNSLKDTAETETKPLSKSPQKGQ